MTAFLGGISGLQDLFLDKLDLLLKNKNIL
jgi:hypothetical protein